jgi:protein ImuB
MLWLCISLPQLPLEALCSIEPTEITVVTVCEGSTRWVICCNTAAARAGLRTAMNYTLAASLYPDLRVIERKPQAERSALERLGAWSYQFSSQVVLSAVPTDIQHAATATVWLEIGASLRLFGGFRALVEALEADLGYLGYTYHLGIAPTLEGAALLARAGIRIAITTVHALYERIRALPVQRLALPDKVVQQLSMVGIRTIGGALELPRAAVAKRFGTTTSHYFDRLMGLASDPRPTFDLPEKYFANFEFGFEVSGTEALLFPVRRMLREFAGALIARDVAVQRFQLTFVHRREPPTELAIGLSVAERNHERFFTLVREQLTRVALPAPSLELRLSADEYVVPGALQPDLLNGALHQEEELSHTLDRIAARLGAEHVRVVHCVADHRPESGWAPAPYAASSPTLAFPDRPLWLLPEPKPLESSSIPIAAAHPERIESGWWDDKDIERDYYIVRTNNGADLWVFRDLRDSAWYLHGFWS